MSGTVHTYRGDASSGECYLVCGTALVEVVFLSWCTVYSSEGKYHRILHGIQDLWLVECMPTIMWHAIKDGIALAAVNKYRIWPEYKKIRPIIACHVIVVMGSTNPRPRIPGSIPWYWPHRANDRVLDRSIHAAMRSTVKRHSGTTYRHPTYPQVVLPSNRLSEPTIYPNFATWLGSSCSNYNHERGRNFPFSGVETVNKHHSDDILTYLASKPNVKWLLWQCTVFPWRQGIYLKTVPTTISIVKHTILCYRNARIGEKKHKIHNKRSLNMDRLPRQRNALVARSCILPSWMVNPFMIRTKSCWFWNVQSW